MASGRERPATPSSIGSHVHTASNLLSNHRTRGCPVTSRSLSVLSHEKPYTFCDTQRPQYAPFHGIMIAHPSPKYVPCGISAVGTTSDDSTPSYDRTQIMHTPRQKEVHSGVPANPPWSSIPRSKHQSSDAPARNTSRSFPPTTEATQSHHEQQPHATLTSKIK